MSQLQSFIPFNNGEKMPIIGLGTWQTSDEEIEAAVNSALEAGYRHIDTAFNYRNEAAIGKTLKKWLQSGRIKREELFIVTKLPLIGNRAESVEKYIKKSLSALQLDYVDLYLIHYPVGLIDQGNDDPFPRDTSGQLLLDLKTDLVQIWKAMEAQVDAGRAHSIGLSNFNSEQIMRIMKSCRIKPANNQVELHVYFQQRELVAFCRALEITICAYSPIGSPGFFSFMNKLGEDTSASMVSPITDPVVVEIANAHNKTPAQVLLRHIIQRGIPVIPKSKSPERINENIQVFDFNLSDEEVDRLDALDRGSKGRIFVSNYSFFKGMTVHPEYPMHIRY